MSNENNVGVDGVGEWTVDNYFSVQAQNGENDGRREGRCHFYHHPHQVCFNSGKRDFEAFRKKDSRDEKD